MIVELSYEYKSNQYFVAYATKMFVRINRFYYYRYLCNMKKPSGYGFYIDKTLKKLQSIYLQSFRENDIDLTIEQWAILHRIYELGDKASQTEITKTNYRNRATTSRVIAGLVNKKLIVKERFAGDSKRYKLTVTQEGKRIVATVEPIMYKLRKIGLKNIDKEDYDVFLSVLENIWENYDAYEQ